jgi:hypothetical protein
LAPADHCVKQKITSANNAYDNRPACQAGSAAILCRRGDNNLPFSTSREPNKAEDNEFVLLRVDEFLKAR